MSQARVETFTSRKDHGKCEKCGTALPAGARYRTFKVGFRSRYQHNRCMSMACTPTRAELESSQMAEIYGAQDDAEANITAAAVGDFDAVNAALQDVRDAIENVASVYREADDAMGGSGSTASAERADVLESAYIDDVDEDEFEDWCSDHVDDEAWSAIQAEDPDAAGVSLDDARQACDACNDAQVDWWTGIVEDALGRVADVEIEA